MPLDGPVTILRDEDASLPTTCFPLVIPKNTSKCALLPSCVGIDEGLHLESPKFSLASSEKGSEFPTVLHPRGRKDRPRHIPYRQPTRLATPHMAATEQAPDGVAVLHPLACYYKIPRSISHAHLQPQH